MKKIYKIIGVLLIIPAMNHGYFADSDKLTNNEHTIFLFSDIHSLEPYGVWPDDGAWNKKKQQSNEQRRELIAEAEKLKAFVIVEDMLFAADKSLYKSVAEFSDGIEKKFKENPRCFNPNKDFDLSLLSDLITLERDKQYKSVSPLVFLSQFCKQSNIPVTNVEFRFAGPNEHEDRVAICKENIREVEAFNDDEKLNRIYKEKMEISNKLDLNKDLKDQEVAITQPIIDCKILHEIYKCKNRNIFICAGKDHIENIKKILNKQLGYKIVAQCSEHTEPPSAINLEKCFKKFCMPPISGCMV